MARVLICWELGNGLAYIEGLNMAARVIAKAGHEVQFAVRDLSHAERVLGTRFPYHQAPTTVIQRRMVLKHPMTFADVLINLGYGNPDAVVARVRAWRNLLDMVQPDIVRCAHAPGALLAARGTGIRSLVVGIGFLIPPSTSPLPSLRSWRKDAKPELMAAREQVVLEGMNRGLDAIAAPRVASVGALYGEADRRELYTYPELDDHGPRDDVRYLGNFQPGMGAVPEWPALPGKKIFAYLEPIEGVGAVLKALAGTGLPTLAYLPHAAPQLMQQYGGSSLRITDRPLDVLQATAACDLGLNMGGHNIVGSFLAAGKPQLMLPIYFTERVTAGKVAALGAGVMSGLEKLAVNLAVLQQESYAAKARATAERLQHFSMTRALENAVDTVNQLAAMGPRK